MPRRRDPIKTRELPVLLRDAQPTWHEIAGKPNQRKRRERERARVSALEVLMRMYREAEERGALGQLDPRIRNCIEGEKARNGGRLPKPKGGKPLGHRDNKRFLLAVQVQEAIEARGEKRGSVAEALEEVAEREGRNEEGPSDRDLNDRLREIHYDRDPEWRRDVKLELARRKWEATLPFSPALWFWEVEFDPRRDL
jgi:hypothetical protein